MIGLKLADGSFYPVLEDGVPETKKIILTTAMDNQETVHIVLVRGKRGDSDEDLTFIRELFLQGLEPAPRGVHDITLTLSLNADLTVHAQLEAPRLPPDWNYEAPRGPSGRRVKRKRGKKYPMLEYGESSVPSNLTAAQLAAMGVYIRPNAVSLAAFVVLGLFICAVLAFIFFSVFRSPPQAPLVLARGETPLRAVLLPCLLSVFRRRKIRSAEHKSRQKRLSVLTTCVQVVRRPAQKKNHR
ncbi:MAG: Hsp70 family protein [Spirochaetaceae bacterium]|nr:Hsp70 family protein [Spirochaetaceae bacterium]